MDESRDGMGLRDQGTKEASQLEAPREWELMKTGNGKNLEKNGRRMN